MVSDPAGWVLGGESVTTLLSLVACCAIIFCGGWLVGSGRMRLIDLFGASLLGLSIGVPFLVALWSMPW